MDSATLHLRSCHLCEEMCGIEVRVTSGEITRVRANQNDVWSKGYLCPKGATLGRLHHDPDRLRTPLVRDANGVLQPASWDDAFARAQDILHGIIARHGRSALAVRTGNAAGRSTSLSRYIAAFSGLAKIARYGSSTVDQQPKIQLQLDVRQRMEDCRGRYCAHRLLRGDGSQPGRIDGQHPRLS